ncbi:MAG: trehalose-6-phosphate synthase, partial [Blastocatellia bacterium]
MLATAVESGLTMMNYMHTHSDQNRARLESLVEPLLKDRKLIIASNRGPVEFHINESTGNLEGKRGAGGVVTAISAASKFGDPIWIACAMGDGDRRAAAEAEGHFIEWSQTDLSCKLRFITPDEQKYKDYYGAISNPLLWFLQHYMWDSPRTPNIT